MLAWQETHISLHGLITALCPIASKKFNSLLFMPLTNQLLSSSSSLIHHVAGIEQFKQPDARLKAGNKPDIFRAEVTEKDIDYHANFLTNKANLKYIPLY